jgi:hypothetical protein
MVAFISFPSQETGYSTRHPPGVEDDILMDSEIIGDFESDAPKLTFPGESLTSSQAYMRSVTVPCQPGKIITEGSFG